VAAGRGQRHQHGLVPLEAVVDEGQETGEEVVLAAVEECLVLEAGVELLEHGHCASVMTRSRPPAPAAVGTVSRDPLWRTGPP
jgi:hypothetical protein